MAKKTLGKIYRLRRAIKNKKSLEVTFPYEVVEKKAISKASFEDIIFEYQTSLISIERLKLEIEEMKMDLADYEVKAPFECKVIRRIVCKGSGTQYGTELLEIKKL